MITYYNSRPGPAIRLTPENAPRRRIRWTVMMGHNRSKRLSLEDATDIRNAPRNDSSQSLVAIAAELHVAPETLRAMLKAHGINLNFRFREA